MAHIVPPKPRFFAGLDVALQATLTKMVEYEYEPYDCTDLQELAAKAYLLGYREAASQFSAAMNAPAKSLIIQ